MATGAGWGAVLGGGGGGEMKLFNFAWRFGLAAFMFWCAAQELSRENYGWATVYLVLGVLNMIFAVDGTR